MSLVVSLQFPQSRLYEVSNISIRRHLAWVLAALLTVGSLAGVSPAPLVVQSAKALANGLSKANAPVQAPPAAAGSPAGTLTQLGATYLATGVTFNGTGFQIKAHTAVWGRAGHLNKMSTKVARSATGATYGAGDAAVESFRAVENGIEQSFVLATRLPGRGHLVVGIPIEGLRAVTGSAGINLVDKHGHVLASYSDLKVTDALGRPVKAVMSGAHRGQEIVITVEDQKAVYPITIDPTWTQTPAQLNPSDGVVGDDFGHAVAVDGSIAVVGAYFKKIGSNADQGAAYVFVDKGGTWSQAQELIAPDGGYASEFGNAVAIEGSTIFVAAWGNGDIGGHVYVYQESGSAWVLSQELSEPDPTAKNFFGNALAVSGSTLVVGDDEHTDGQNTYEGDAYVYASSGGAWSLASELTPQNGIAQMAFGKSVTVSGSTIAIGASSQGYGQVYIFDSVSGTWSQATVITASSSGTGLGGRLALSGATLVASESPGVDVYQGSGTAWNLTQTFTEASDTCFGNSVAIDGSVMVVGAPGCDGAPSAVYAYTESGSSWSQQQQLTAGYYGDSFGQSVGISGATVIGGAVEPMFNGYQGPGTAYVFSSLDVQPQGAAVTTDAYVNGSLSEPACGCGGALAARGGPVNLATGDEYLQDTDLSLPGAGIPLIFERSYDAQEAQAQASAVAGAPSLGYGWSYNLGMSVQYNAQTSTTAVVTEENGAQVDFAPYQQGTSPAWCGSSTNFCATAPRVEATLNHNTDGTWTFARSVGGQETFTFSSAGGLTEIADAAGHNLTASSYAPTGGQTPCPAGDTCTVWTSSGSGRQLALAFANGQLGQVFDPNSSLAATFAYSGSGCTSWGSGQTPDLCAVTDPGGLTSTYTYDSGNSNATMAYDLLSQTAPGQSGPTADQYDTSGRVIQESDPSGQVLTFAYAGTNASFLGGTTTVTDYPDGTGTGLPQQVTVYQFSSNILVATTAGSGTSGASTVQIERDAISLMPLWETDGNGHVAYRSYASYNLFGGTPVSSGDAVSSSDAAGDTTAHAYNSLNQAWCDVSAAETANGVSCPGTAPTTPPAPGASDPYKGATIRYFNGSDELTAVTDSLGDTTTYSYTSGVAGVPDGLAYCSVDPVDYQESVACPAYGAAHVIGTTTATFDSAGDRLTSTDADGNTTSYVYSAPGLPGAVSSETDPDGTVTNFAYNGAGQVTSQTVTYAGYSATTLNAYDTQGRKFCTVSALETANGVTCPAQPPSSPPTISNDPYPGATITTYDPDGRVTQVTNPLGGISYTAYDAAGEVFCAVSAFESAQGVTCPTSAPTTPPTPGSDPYLGATITSYDANGRVVQVTNPLGGITTTSYDQANNVTQTTVESNNTTAAPNVVTAHSYDAANRLISTTVDPGSGLAATTDYSYDPNGDTFCQVSPNVVSSGSYQCPTWQTAWIATPANPTALYSTSPNSSQANNVTTTFFNDAGQQVQTTNANVDTTVTAADGDGRSYCNADPTNVTTWLTANPNGTWPYLCPTTPPTSPPAQGSNPGYTTTIYDPAGRTLSSTDQVGDTTSHTYTPGGQTLTTTDGRGQVTTNCYYYQNATGQCAQNAPAAGGSADMIYSTTTPATTADPAGETTTHTYDPGGPAETTTTPAGTSTDTYDANGDLTAVNYSGAATGYTAPANLAYTYNTDGSRATMVDGTGTTSYTYDANGDTTSQILSAAPGTGLTDTTTSYGYYSTGVPASITYPAYTNYPNPQVNYNYDPTGTMTSETDWLGNQVTFGHDQNGNTTSQANNVTTGNPAGSSSTTFSYDNADLNTTATSTFNQTCGGPETLAQAFTGAGGSRNADGQLTGYTSTYNGSCSGQTGTQRSYSYDLAGRLVYQGSAAQGTSPNNFTYDPSGDPTTISSHDTNANFDTYTQAFDSAGEITAQTPNAGSGGVSSTYGYDTLGDQTQITTPTNTASATYDQTGRLAAFQANKISLVTAAGEQAAGTGNPATAIPLSGIAPGDQILVFVTQNGGTIGSPTSGGTGNYGQVAQEGATTVFTKTATTGDTSVSEPTVLGDAISIVVAAYRGVDDTHPIDATNQNTNNSTSVTVGSLTANQPGDELVMSMSGTGNLGPFNWTAPNGMTTESAQTTQAQTSQAIADQTLTVNGPTGSRTASYSDPLNTQLNGILVALKPANTLYTYNGDGNAIASTTKGATTQLTWTAPGRLPQILSDSTYDYVYGPTGTPVEQIALATSTPTYLTYTQADDTWLSTNQAGDETGYWGYDAYGTPAFGTPTTPFGYSGQYMDTTTGLVNDRARWYQSQTGGFTSRDPMFSSTDTAYTYAGGDPVNSSDPTGLTNVLPGGGFAPGTSAACEQAIIDQINYELWFNQLSPLQQEAINAYINPDFQGGSSSNGVVNLLNNVANGIGNVAQNVASNAGNVIQIASGALVTVIGGGLCVVGSAGLDVATLGGATVLTPGEVVACGAIGAAGVGLSANGIRGWHSSSSSSGSGSGDQIPKTPTSSYGKSAVPSWVTNEGYVPFEGETPAQTATRIMNSQYGEGNWSGTGPGSEYSQILKWASRHF